MYQKDVKVSNENKIFRYIFDMETSASISDIAKSTKMTFPTVKRVIDKFLRKNIIYEWTRSSGGVGRRAVEYKYNENFCYLIGCGVDGNRIKIRLFDTNGEKILKETYECGEEKTFEIFKESLKNFLANLENTYKEKLIGIGLSIPGIYSKENGFFEIHITETVKIDSLKEFEKEIGYSIWVENEANMSVLTEAILGSHKKLNDFTVIIINNDVTCSTFNKLGLDNEEYFFKASRINHIIIDYKNQKTAGDCISCKVLKKKIKEKFSIEKLDDFFTNKNYFESEEGKEILKEYLYCLGIVLKNLIFTYNPEKLIISGEISKYSKYLLSDILEIVYPKEHIFYRGKETLNFSKFRGDSNIIGAAIFPLVDKFM